ncbi:MAG: DMT family transporter [Paracoccaceae bacterium]
MARNSSSTLNVGSEYAFGVFLLVASAVTFSTAGLFTKGVAAGAWAVIFWRGVFAMLATTAWAASRSSLKKEFIGMGAAGLAVAVVGAAGQVAFISSFKLTSVANVALIYAVAPILAALMAWLTIRERVGRQTMICAAVAFLGVGVVVSGSVGSLNLRGDFLALAMTMVMAGIMVIYRAHPNTPSAGPSVLQSALLLPFAVVFGEPFRTDPGEIAILAVFGILFAIASVTLAEGAKRVPSGQTALIGALETPLAPLFALLVLSEMPPTPTLLGGAIVFAAVLASMWKTSFR